MARAERQTGETSSLTMTDVLVLPDAERQIVQWMLGKAEAVSLAEVAAYMGEEESVTDIRLDYIVQRGFVEEIAGVNQLCYRIHFHPEIAKDDLHLLAPGLPLALITNPSGVLAVVAGSTFELYVTVINKGNRSAVIDVFLEESQMLFQWCVSPYKQQLALDFNTSNDLSFEFQVPLQTLPGIYNYILVVDAPQHYPEDTPIRYSQQLQVLPPVETAARVSDPTFTVQPVTNSQTPAALQPGELLQLVVQVDNRSDQVDRFRLTCPDLAQSWLEVVYQQGLEQIGVMSAAERLELNPGTKGEILLLLTPARDALAGTYFPTIRLYSANNPDLMLLDVIYFQILPFYQLNAEFLILRSRVRNQEGRFQLKLHNSGNTVRELDIRAGSCDDKEEFCTYTVEPNRVLLLPGNTAIIDLRIKLHKWWRRPVYGGGELINFRVELEDTQQLPLPDYIPQGTLIWEPRPWWQFLLLLLAGVGTLVAIAFLIWWLFFKPPAQPKIVEFAADASLYQADNDNFIRLNWQIRNPRQLQLLSITGQSPDGTAAVQPIVYDFSQGVPIELQKFCNLQLVLTCKGVRTDARKVGDYIFELKVFSKKDKEVASDTTKTNTIKIQPLPLAKIPIPQIIEFDSTQTIYEEALLNQALVNKGAKVNNSILLNWKITNPEQIKEISIIGKAPDGTINSPLHHYDFSQGINKNLKAFCKINKVLICQSVPAGANQAGDYAFELTVFTQQNQGKFSDSKKTNNIKIKPQPARIVKFRINGQDAQPKYLISINQANKPLSLSWQVEGSKDTKVQLLPAPGDVPLSGTASYPVNPKPGSEMITLQVKSPTGDQIARAVLIETYATTQSNSSLPLLAPATLPSLPSPSPNATTSPSSQPSPTPSPSSSSSPGIGSPSPAAPDLLSPFELPPKTD